MNCQLYLLMFVVLCRWTCKLEKFTFYATSDTAIWVLVVFTVDRVIAVTSPLRKHVLCAPRRAIFACCLVVLLAVCKNFHVFWTRDIEYRASGQVKRVCGRPDAYKYFENQVRPWLALTLISVVPFFVIILSNAIIIRKLIHAHQVRNQTLSGNPLAAHGNGRHGVSEKNDRLPSLSPVATTVRLAGLSAVFSQTSLMCLAVSVAFLVCVTPSIVLTIGRETWKSHAAYYYARAVSHQLSCSNHAINFFLYCITGQRFRTELMSLMSRRRTSSFDEITRNYYMTRRSTRCSTSLLAMSTLPMTTLSISPIQEHSEDDKGSKNDIPSD